MSLRLAFMGTPVFALPSLAALIAAGHEIVCVYSQPARASGRGLRSQPSPIAAYAEEAGLMLRTPSNFKEESAQDDFAALKLDAAIVVAYGLLLPRAILNAPIHGCLNLHASLLPRWRGAAPIQRAIMTGDDETGVMIMQMDEGLDTGPILAGKKTKMERKTSGQLHGELAHTGAQLVVETLKAVAKGQTKAQAQSQAGITYAKKIEKAEAHIDWTKPARELDCLIRGLSPFPGAWFEVKGERIKVLMAEPVAGKGVPGEVLGGTTIACGDGALKLMTLQRAGKAAQDSEAFQRGFTLPQPSLLRS